MKGQCNFNRMLKIDRSALKLTGSSPHMSLSLLITMGAGAVETPPIALGVPVSWASPLTPPFHHPFTPHIYYQIQSSYIINFSEIFCLRLIPTTATCHHRWLPCGSFLITCFSSPECVLPAVPQAVVRERTF